MGGGGESPPPVLPIRHKVLVGKQSAFVPDFRRGSDPWSWTCPVWTGGSFGFMELILFVFFGWTRRVIPSPG